VLLTLLASPNSLQAANLIALAHASAMAFPTPTVGQKKAGSTPAPS
jgi:hypothetical protein